MTRKLICFLFTLFLVSHNTIGAALPKLSCDGAILIEPNSNTILYSKNIDETFYPASTTKILTSLIIAEHLDPNSLVTKTQDAINHVPTDSSQIGLNVGDQFTVNDALHAVLMESDNFVCYDLAKMEAGSIPTFAEKMNEFAYSSGAYHSHFVNPHGYHDEAHYVTPYDLSQIARLAFSNETVKEIAGTYQYNFKVANTGRTIPLTHTAPLLNQESSFYNPHVVAVKTGYHTPAGRTLVAKAEYGDIDLIAVIMRTDAPKQFEDINKLFDYGSSYFKSTLNEETGTYTLTNTTYSDWAKPYVMEALSKGWITSSSRNYTTPITKRDFLNLMQRALSDTSLSIESQSILLDGPSIYKENILSTKGEIAEIIFNALSPLNLMSLPNDITIEDINHLPKEMQQAIYFIVKADIMSLDRNHNFNPNEPVTYEEALYSITKIYNIITKYSDFHLPDYALISK